MGNVGLINRDLLGIESLKRALPTARKTSKAEKLEQRITRLGRLVPFPCTSRADLKEFQTGKKPQKAPANTAFLNPVVLATPGRYPGAYIVLEEF